MIPEEASSEDPAIARTDSAANDQSVPLPPEFIIWPFDESCDSVTEMTELLHRAYRPLAEAGMRYLASHQDDSVTRNRINKGECYVAASGMDGRIIGTVVFVPPGIGDHECAYYNRPDVAWFQQLAVEPSLQGQGIGSALMEHIEVRAWEMGAAEIALDTSERAHELIRMYTKRGYRIVDAADWVITNYRSVIMTRERE